MYYEIENAELKVGVETKGAQLKSIRSKKTDTEYLWQGDEEFWKGRAYNLFPIVGRAYKNKYDYEGKTYETRPHGIARDQRIRFSRPHGNEAFVCADVHRSDAENLSVQIYLLRNL